MSFCPLNRIRDFWSSKPFLRQIDFPIVMSRGRFDSIKSNLNICIDGVVTQVYRDMDPLWNIRSMLSRFQTRSQAYAVPKYCASLDENSVRTKARTRAKSYILSKPDKYAIRFYCLVDWKSTYCSVYLITDQVISCFVKIFLRESGLKQGLPIFHLREIGVHVHVPDSHFAPPRMYA